MRVIKEHRKVKLKPQIMDKHTDRGKLVLLRRMQDQLLSGNCSRNICEPSTWVVWQHLCAPQSEGDASVHDGELTDVSIQSYRKILYISLYHFTKTSFTHAQNILVCSSTFLTESNKATIKMANCHNRFRHNCKHINYSKVLHNFSFKNRITYSPVTQFVAEHSQSTVPCTQTSHR